MIDHKSKHGNFLFASLSIVKHILACLVLILLKHEEYKIHNEINEIRYNSIRGIIIKP